MADRDPQTKRTRDAARMRDKRATTPEFQPIDPNTVLSKQLRQVRADNQRLRTDLTAALKRADAAEDIREGVFGLSQRDISTAPAWTWKPKGGGSHMHTPIIFTSDNQYGEVIRRADLGGMNEFNKRIYATRYDKMITKSIRWCDAIALGWDAEYRGVIYLRGGDAISNSIHDDLAETNDVSAVPAVRELTQLERAGILRLRDRFGKVHVISIPGNHGRTTLKPRAKHYVDLNFETIIAWWLADSLRNEEGITCEVPESGEAYFAAEGWRFLMSHGDRMGAGGGKGFIGTSAPIIRGHQKLFMDAQAGGTPVDVILTGHYHTSIKTPWGFANGSFPGYSEFAQQHKMMPDAAKQWLLFAHADRVYGQEIDLSPRPRRSA